MINSEKQKIIDKRDLQKEFSNRTITIDIIFQIVVVLILAFLPYVIEFLARKPLCIGVAQLLKSMFATWWDRVPIWLGLYLIGVFLWIFARIRIGEWNKKALIALIISNLISLVGISAYVLEVAKMPGFKESIVSNASFRVEYIVLGIFIIIYMLDMWEAKKKVTLWKKLNKLTN